MTDHQFIFSVIIPFYEVKRYLAEAIESVLAQTIGFEDNIELILANDGSSDGSESVCLGYQSVYPDNVTYVRQDHAGVSSARNNGMQHADHPPCGLLRASRLGDVVVSQALGLQLVDQPLEATPNPVLRHAPLLLGAL